MNSWKFSRQVWDRLAILRRAAPQPSANPISETLTAPAVSIGETQARVVFAGLAPGFVGLYQINAQVPGSAPSGENVPLVISIGGLDSLAVTIAVE